MGLTQAQSRAFAKGTQAAMQRDQEQQRVVFEISLPSQMKIYWLIEYLRTVLYRAGILNAATSSIRVITDFADTLALVVQQAEELRRVTARNTELQERETALMAENEQLRKQGSAPATIDVAAPPKWVSVREAALFNDCSQDIIYRAIPKGHIQARSKRIGTNMHHEVVANTLVRWSRPPAQSKKK